MTVKPGYKTTEFWVTVLTYVVNLANVTGLWDWTSNWHSGVLMGVAGAAYKVARGLAKSGVLKAPA